MNRLRTSMLVALILALSSFHARAEDKAKGKEKAEKAETIKASDYYPMAVGNTWNYKLGDMKFSMKITKHEMVDKVLCARVEMIVDNSVKAFEHIGVTPDGIYRFSYEGKKTEPPVRILKLPPKAGDSWEVNAKVGGEVLKGVLKGGEEDVKVPAGNYPKAVTSTADDFDANGTKMAFKYFFAKDVGMVKQELDVNGQKAIIELEKFEPGKK